MVLAHQIKFADGEVPGGEEGGSMFRVYQAILDCETLDCFVPARLRTAVCAAG